MKKILAIFFILILSLIFIYHYNNNPKGAIFSLFKDGNMQGEALRYKIYLLGIFPAGEAIFNAEKEETYNGQKVYHLIANAKPTGLCYKVFKGYAILDSYMDIRTRNPILFKQEIGVSDKKVVNKEVLYDQKNEIVTISGVKRQMLSNTQDPLSALFNIRHMDFNKLKEFELSLNTNQKNYVLKATVSPEDLLINNKEYKTFILQGDIRRRDKNLYHQSKVTAVLLKGEKENIPVWFKVFASGFLISAKLIAIK